MIVQGIFNVIDGDAWNGNAVKFELPGMRLGLANCLGSQMKSWSHHMACVLNGKKQVAELVKAIFSISIYLHESFFEMTVMWMSYVFFKGCKKWSRCILLYRIIYIDLHSLICMFIFLLVGWYIAVETSLWRSKINPVQTNHSWLPPLLGCRGRVTNGQDRWEGMGCKARSPENVVSHTRHSLIYAGHACVERYW